VLRLVDAHLAAADYTASTTFPILESIRLDQGFDPQIHQ